MSLGVTGSFQRGVTIIGVENEGHLAEGGTAPLGRILYTNATFEAMTGRSAEQLLGSSFDMLIGPDTEPEQVSHLREALTCRQPDTFRLLCYRSNGTTFWNSVSIAPISSGADTLRQVDRSRIRVRDSDNPSGPPVCYSPPLPLNSMFFIVLHDDVSSIVSEQAGFRLRDQALHSCAEGITIVDPSLPDEPIVYANDAFLQMTG